MASWADAPHRSFFYTNNNPQLHPNELALTANFSESSGNSLPPCAQTSSSSSQCRATLGTQAYANTWTSASCHGHSLLEIRMFSFHPLLGHCPTKGPDVYLGAIRRTTHNFWGHLVSSGVPWSSVDPAQGSTECRNKNQLRTKTNTVRIRH